MISVGVLALQGAVSEHEECFKQALFNLEERGRVMAVKTVSDLHQCDCVAIPGGESTSIFRLMHKTGIFSELQKLGKKNFPIFGTCAGLVLLAKKGDSQVAQSEQKLLSLVDMQIERNAFGRQKDSFEAPVRLAFDDNPFNGVFIRAPGVTEVWGGAKPVAWLKTENGGEKIVGVQQGKILALSFHPELSQSTLVHEHFLTEFVL